MKQGMRLTPYQVDTIRTTVAQVAGVVEPALLSAHPSRAMEGCQVDVVVKAPNLAQSRIHSITLQEGISL